MAPIIDGDLLALTHYLPTTGFAAQVRCLVMKRLLLVLSSFVLVQGLLAW